ncbi:MAG: D-amino acid aminotransferase [Gammaproteobacteria bacterium]|nr:D-amino acid aminotransferase [Gammaproteobacteria bacterium]
MSTVYLNGDFIPQEQAVVSVMDRGFLFGDGVYEVLPVYKGKIFRFEHHINRLYHSLKSIKLSISLVTEDWRKIFEKLLELNSHLGKNQSIYLQVTRGPAPERNHAFPKQINPTIFVFSYPLKTLPMEVLSKGMSAITLEDSRWQFCNIKATSLLSNVLLYQQAIDQGLVEAILIRNGEAVEGSTSNLFIVKNQIIQTPPLSNHILGGVTRDLVLELAKKDQLPCEEKPVSLAALYDADEVWITSSTREIYPIIKVDDKTINQGVPGNIWHKMIQNYHNFINNL